MQLCGILTVFFLLGVVCHASPSFPYYIGVGRYDITGPAYGVNMVSVCVYKLWSGVVLTCVFRWGMPNRVKAPGESTFANGVGLIYLPRHLIKTSALCSSISTHAWEHRL